jgi:predicted metal-dependent phosphoesterase TrpH
MGAADAAKGGGIMGAADVAKGAGIMNGAGIAKADLHIHSDKSDGAGVAKGAGIMDGVDAMNGADATNGAVAMKGAGVVKADLHIHSDRSDGPLSAGAIVRQAKGSGVGLISITDHDTAAWQGECARLAAEAGLRYISGIEISAFDRQEGARVHILGYGFRDGGLLDSFCEPINRGRREAGLEMARRVAGMGYGISVGDVLQYAGGGIIYRQHIMRALFDRGFADGIYSELFPKLFGEGGPAFCPFEYADACEAVAAVRQAGGLAVVAHPASYNNWGCLPRLIGAGLGGLEARHPDHSGEDAARLLAMARESGLFATSGSDFHGMYAKKPRPIGYGCEGACEAILERI